MSEWLPLAATGVSAAADLRGGRSDANALEAQARTVRNQAARDEEAQRRENRQRLGTLAAAFAQAGGGGDAGVLRQSAINAELDALNVRYAGAQRASALFGAASAQRKQSRLLAGAKLLSGVAQTWAARKLPSTP